MLLAHCVLRAADAVAVDRPEPALAGVRAVVRGPVAAVVSDAPERDLVEEDAVQHLDVLAALTAEVPVLPLALGTAAPDDAAVREEVLDPEQDWPRLLDEVADVVEVRLDLTFDTEALVADVVAADPELRRQAQRSRGAGARLPDQLALGERVAAEVADHQDQLADEWTREVADVAVRSRLLHTDERLRRFAYLLARDRLAHADEAVDRLARQAEGRATVAYVGPLPVFSFLDEIQAEPEPSHSRWGW